MSIQTLTATCLIKLSFLIITLSIPSTFLTANSTSHVDQPEVVATSLSTQNTGSEMILIPSGEFTMGSNKQEEPNKPREFSNAKPWYMDEHPEHKVMLESFHMDKYEVTNAQYRNFVQAINTTPLAHWVETGFIVSTDRQKIVDADVKLLRKLVSKVLKIDKDTRMLSKVQLIDIIDTRMTQLDKLPVTHIRWRDANDYCKWAGKQLPTEQQWEKAARGPNGQEFIWGNEWKKSMTNSGGELWQDGTAPIGSYETDKSPYGIYDLGGNVSEWVADWYLAYEGSDFESKLFGHTQRVAKGAGWSSMGHYSLKLFQRGAYRLNLNPDSTFNDVGFRCVKPAS